MYADYDIASIETHPLSTFCQCGCTIHLKESEASELVNIIVCPVCGYKMQLIRNPAYLKIDKD